MRKLLILAFIISLLMIMPHVYALQPNEDKPIVVVTISPLYLIAKEVVGSKAIIHVLAPAGVDPHSYSPTPRDVMLVSTCDLFICIGREEFLGQLPKPEHGLILSWDSWIKSGIYIKNDNPHYLWLYPPNAKILAYEIAKAMSLLDPQSSSYYITQAKLFSSKIDELNNWLKSVMSKCGGANVILAGDHFEPLIEWMGLDISYVIIRGQGGLPGPQRIKDAIIKAKNSKLIIASATQIEGYEGLYARQVSRESGIPVVYLYGIPLSMNDTYIEFIKYNVMIIASHLESDAPHNPNSPIEGISISLITLFASISIIEGLMILRLKRG